MVFWGQEKIGKRLSQQNQHKGRCMNTNMYNCTLEGNSLPVNQGRKRPAK